MSPLGTVGSNAGLAFTSLENQTEVVRWHFDDLGEHESGAVSNLRHRLQVAETPLRIVPAKIGIELCIALRGVATVAAIRPGQEQDMLRGKQGLRAFEQR